MGVSLGNRQKQYQQFLKGRQPTRPVLRNVLRAFLAGGTICLLGQGIQELFVHYYHMSEKMAGNPTVAILIMLSAVLTGIGIYDQFSQWAGAGSAVPVTGFANAMTSAALEHKTEGYVVGIGSNMFKLAGPVIVFGVVSAFFVGLARYIILHV
ncbi:MAG: stage V sporulation protein AC [Acidibacillus sp.]|uniref:Stage V sporulation protein AC n=1 Tax=Sulfoacidibacillus ferrooxidans TaxID=2005001 RepID=A0A9X1VAI2_9BACL|nr:stage V sporulation protein AC [Sulfoacidibacillus ferrooxidans]MCI0184097.1 hypothetical protein [Sulfoacidibacillus ferrooxidans]MCY0893041.1 stage V sporulation protein AC [Acidibacillus sp.]